MECLDDRSVQTERCSEPISMQWKGEIHHGITTMGRALFVKGIQKRVKLSNKLITTGNKIEGGCKKDGKGEGGLESQRLMSGRGSWPRASRF
jgi:hypothetical protein